MTKLLNAILLYLVVALVPPQLLSLGLAFVTWERPALYFGDWPVWLRVLAVWWWVVWTGWVGVATVRVIEAKKEENRP